MKHTEGPWKVDHNPSSEIREGWQIGMWQRDVTANTGLGPCATGTGETREEADANAHLIAAAPELLEACRLVLACVNSNNITEQIDNEDAEKLSNVLAGAYKAIAKAEGK